MSLKHCLFHIFEGARYNTNVLQTRLSEHDMKPLIFSETLVHFGVTVGGINIARFFLQILGLDFR